MVERQPVRCWLGVLGALMVDVVRVLRCAALVVKRARPSAHLHNDVVHLSSVVHLGTGCRVDIPRRIWIPKFLLMSLFAPNVFFCIPQCLPFSVFHQLLTVLSASGVLLGVGREPSVTSLNTDLIYELLLAGRGNGISWCRLIPIIIRSDFNTVLRSGLASHCVHHQWR